MNYVVAVSGGVDSVVLLDMLASGAFDAMDDSLIVAHFDHGIRTDSAEDARFVAGLAEKYGLPFEAKREELGVHASEELARERRYAFLRGLAREHDASIVTAHHADDVVETIAINLSRGTGWRGLAVLDSPGIWRPLIDTPKVDLVSYAQEHKLDWHEDSTNADTSYLRNDLRARLVGLAHEDTASLRLYRRRQVALKLLIDEEAARLVGEPPYSRHLFIAVSTDIGIELLRTVLVRETGEGATRPQLQRALHAIKTYHGGKRFEVSTGRHISFTKTNFVVAAS